MTKKARANQIAAMVNRAKDWMSKNPGKMAEIYVTIPTRLAHHGLMRLPLDFAIAEQFIHCNQSGKEFVRALVQDDLSPTVSMYFAMSEQLDQKYDQL